MFQVKWERWLITIVVVVWIGGFVAIPQAWSQIDPNNPAGVPSAGAVKKSGKKARWWKRLSASVSLTTSLGTGSFAPSESYKNHFVAQSVFLTAGYQIWKGLSAQASWSFDWEYTQPDNASGRRFFPRDVNLVLGWTNPIKAIQKALFHNISINVQLPSSLLAQVETRLLRVGMGLSLGHTIKRIVTFNYSFGFNKSFHRYTSPVFNQSDAELPSIMLRQSTRNGIGLSDGMAPVPGSRNTEWMVQNTLTVMFYPHKTVTIGASFGIFHLFRYAMPIDEFTPVIPTVDGPVQADAVGRIDFTVGDIFVSWRPIRYFSMALGATSWQTPFAGNNRSLRLPFLNVVTANDNTTTFYLRLTGSY